MAGIYQRELPTAPVFTPSRQYQSVDFGVNSMLKAGSILGEALGSIRDKELVDNKLKMQQDEILENKRRWDIANARADAQENRVLKEYDREIGLRDARKNLAAEYEANPYADVWGGGAATKGLDKQVLDYVNAGGEINQDMAGRLQAEYEKNRPFKEDIAQVFRSKLLAAGEDPTKADAYAKSMTDSMPFSRATQQAQLDKQQENTQKWYDAQATANLEALKLNMDANKVNANNATDIMKSRISSGFGGGVSGGGGSKGTAPGGYSNLTADELSLSWMPAFTKMGDEAATQDIINGLQQKSVPSGIAQKALEESVVTKGADRYVDKNLLKSNVDRYMGVYGQTMGGGAGTTTVNAEVNPKTLLAQFAPRQIAGYDPQGILERARVTVPELFGKDTVVTPSTPTVVAKDGYDNTVKKLESSGGKYDAVNKNSGAIGAYQFIPSTLDDYRGKKGNPNFTNEEFIKNPELQDKVFKQFTQGNENILRNKGIEVNDYTKWIAHNLGAGNVKDFVEGKETPKLVKAMSAQFGGKPTTIADYNEFFGKNFTGNTTADVNKDVSELVRNFDAKTPVTTGTDINTRYNDIQSIVEPTLSADTELTQDKIKELVDKYKPVIDEVRADISENGDGLIDRKRYVDTLLKDKVTKEGVTKKDREWANSVVDSMLTEYAPTEASDPTAVGGIGNKQKIYSIKELMEKPNSSASTNDALSTFLSRYNADTTKAVEQQRQLAIADKYRTNPNLLSIEEIRWINGNKQTPNGRNLLESLGIK